MGNELEAERQGCGTIVLSLTVNGAFKKCLLKNGIYVPKLQFSLVSVGVLWKKRFQISFYQSRVNILFQRKLFAAGSKVKTLYVLDANEHKKNCTSCRPHHIARALWICKL